MDEPCWARHLPVYVRDTRQGHDRIRELDELLQISDDLLPEPTLSKSGIEDTDGSTLGVEADISDLGGFVIAREAVVQYRREAYPRMLRMAVRAAGGGLENIREEQERVKTELEDLEWLMNRIYESSSGFQYPTCPRLEDCTGPCTREEVCIKAVQVRTVLCLKWEIYSEVVSRVRVGGELEDIRKELRASRAAASQAVELHRFAVEENISPDDFGGQTTLFYDWCGEKLKCGRTTALNKLKDWGIYIKGKKGKRGDKLDPMIQRLKSKSFWGPESFQSEA